MFEQASKLKIRYTSNKGLLTVEDLWDLPLTTKKPNGVSLDTLAQSVNCTLKATANESFVVTPTSTINTILELQLNIIKHIIAVKMAANLASLNKKVAETKKARIQDIIASKEDAALSEMSVEDLQKMSDSM